MAKKKKDAVTINFLNNGTNVTGSCTIIKFLDRTILFEFGGIQDGHTVLENYKLNKNQVSKVKPKEIDMIIGGHIQHFDHGGNIPYLIKNNKDIRIITPKDTKGILKEMWLDSAGIMERDCELLSKKFSDKVFIPLYDSDDVKESYEKIEEYETNQIYELDENLSIRYIYSGHIFGACQCELFIKINNHTHKILFTSDLGNIKTAKLKPFVQEFEPMVNGNIAICESTYGSRENINLTKKIIDKDIEKIKTVVEQYCVDNKRRVLFPVFSLDKCPNILWILYNLFKDYRNFDTKIVIDSPLTNRLLDRYSEVLKGDAKAKFDEMMSWKNIVRIIDPTESKEAVKTLKNCCILSSGGMLQSGRSVSWAISLLPHADDCILLSGYCGVNTLGYKIKNGNTQKTITINGTSVKNKCQIVALKSQSSHMQRNDLINYYKGLNVEKIYLVHGDMQGKIELAEDLREEISKCSKTTKVCVVNKDTTCKL